MGSMRYTTILDVYATSYLNVPQTCLTSNFFVNCRVANPPFFASFGFQLLQGSLVPWVKLTPATRRRDSSLGNGHPIGSPEVITYTFPKNPTSWLKSCYLGICFRVNFKYSDWSRTITPDWITQVVSSQLLANISCFTTASKCLLRLPKKEQAIPVQSNVIIPNLRGERHPSCLRSITPQPMDDVSLGDGHHKSPTPITSQQTLVFKTVIAFYRFGKRGDAPKFLGGLGVLLQFTISKRIWDRKSVV